MVRVFQKVNEVNYQKLSYLFYEPLLTTQCQTHYIEGPTKNKDKLFLKESPVIKNIFFIYYFVKLGVCQS